MVLKSHGKSMHNHDEPVLLCDDLANSTMSLRKHLIFAEIITYQKETSIRDSQ